MQFSEIRNILCLLLNVIYNQLHGFNRKKVRYPRVTSAFLYKNFKMLGLHIFDNDSQQWRGAVATRLPMYCRTSLNHVNHAFGCRGKVSFVRFEL